MDQIEHQVRLPPGFGPITKYGRFYALDNNGRVTGLFIAWTEAGLPVGQRRWLTDDGALPLTFDGGCNVVTVHFDPHSEKLVSTNCAEDS